MLLAILIALASIQLRNHVKARVIKLLYYSIVNFENSFKLYSPDSDRAYFRDFSNMYIMSVVNPYGHWHLYDFL